MAVQMDLFNSYAKINVTGHVNGQRQAEAASASLLAPIPAAGPEAKVYLPNSSRIFVEGNVFGMYFGGYGNFLSSMANVGVAVTKQLSANAGYQIGSRPVVSNNQASDRLGLRLTQRGAIVVMQFAF